MPRESVEPLFSKKKSTSLLPSVVVLPKINGMNGSADKAFAVTRSFQENNRVSNSSFAPMTFPGQSDVEADGRKDSATKSTKNQVRKRSGSNNSNTKSTISDPLCNGAAANMYSSLPPTNKERKDSKNSQERRNGKIMKKIIPNEQFRDLDNSFKTFEDESRRELWHYTKAPPPSFGARRSSLCSSCGGAMSSTISTSTRRFSAVSIEVGSEKNINDSVIGIGAIANDSKIFQDENRQICSNASKTDESNNELKPYYRIQKERNLLYDLISVLYRKNFIKDEVSPYVKHALEICRDGGS